MVKKEPRSIIRLIPQLHPDKKSYQFFLVTNFLEFFVSSVRINKVVKEDSMVWRWRPFGPESTKESLQKIGIWNQWERKFIFFFPSPFHTIPLFPRIKFTELMHRMLEIIRHPWFTTAAKLTDYRLSDPKALGGQPIELYLKWFAFFINTWPMSLPNIHLPPPENSKGMVILGIATLGVYWGGYRPSALSHIQCMIFRIFSIGHSVIWITMLTFPWKHE